MKKLGITAVEYQHKIRQQAKARTKKFRKEQERKGFKNITAYLSKEFVAELERLSAEEGMNRQAAMQHIFKGYQQNITNRVTGNAIKTNSKKTESPANTWSEVKSAPPKKGKKENKLVHKPIKETQMEIPAPMQEPVEPKPEKNMELPEYLINVDPNMPIEERHKIILRLAEDFPGRKNAQIRIDLLNAAGILLGGKQWETTKQFADQHSKARKWSKKQEGKK